MSRKVRSCFGLNLLNSRLCKHSCDFVCRLGDLLIRSGSQSESSHDVNKQDLAGLWLFAMLGSSERRSYCVCTYLMLTAREITPQDHT
jgi:hypothetical protein